MDLYKELNVPASFNVEVLQQIAFSKYKGKYKEINEQYLYWLDTIEYMVNKRFDIQLHLHPQWYNSHYNGQYWILNDKWDITKYKKSEIEDMFRISIDYLSKYIRDQTLNVFRSGSWAIGPPSDTLFHTMEKSGIKVDVSIVEGIYYKGDSVSLDYRSLESPYEPYYPDYNDARRISAKEQNIIEIPTQSVSKNEIDISILMKIVNKILMKFDFNNKKLIKNKVDKQIKNHAIQLDPFGFSSGNAVEEHIIDFAIEYSPLNYYNNKLRKIIMDKCIDRALKSEGVYSYLVFENHTKNLQNDYQFEAIKKIIKHIKNKYKTTVEFVTLDTMARNLHLLSPKINEKKY